MSDAKHTPGPWEALELERANGGKDWNIWGPKGSNHIGDEDLRGDYGLEADARLIAAAPDGLAFAQAFLEWHEGPGETDSPLAAQARAFVAKALGAP